MLRKVSLSAVAGFVVLGVLVLPANNASAITVTRASLNGGLLQVDGMNAIPGVFVRVRSTTDFAGARAESSGEYHVERAGFRADNCQVVVSDGRTPDARVTLSGCTPTG